ncbi:MAG: DUF4258 domain-containing protein [Verrucomicrobia bacterium]|nr:DUF4258 domain-containing protein [Verrucomicrobiota bacterium]
MRSDGYLTDVQLRKAIVDHINRGLYRITKHAADEQAKDGLDLQDTLRVLKTGAHEKSKTVFSSAFQCWKYAIRGKTEDLKEVRVIIAFAKEMMIITVMEL